jgi:hypothetical protein
MPSMRGDRRNRGISRRRGSWRRGPWWSWDEALAAFADGERRHRGGDSFGGDFAACGEVQLQSQRRPARRLAATCRRR